MGDLPRWRNGLIVIVARVRRRGENIHPRILVSKCDVENGIGVAT
jgi:hypothetical protein